jgi:hypothetical protein
MPVHHIAGHRYVGASPIHRIAADAAVCGGSPYRYVGIDDPHVWMAGPVYRGANTVRVGAGNYGLQGGPSYGLNIGADVVPGGPVVGSFLDDLAKPFVSAGKGIVTGIKATEHVLNIPAAAIHKMATHLVPHWMEGTVGFLLPAQAVHTPTTWKEMKDEYNHALPIAQTVLRNCGPWGMAASGALGGLGAAINGGSLEDIAWAAAEGASPTYLQVALEAAQQLRKGHTGDALKTAGNLAATAALDYAGDYFEAGSMAAQGVDFGKKLLKTGSLTKTAVDVARSKMTAEERTGFDVLIGTVARGQLHSSVGQPSKLTAEGKAIPSAAVIAAAHVPGANMVHLAGIVQAASRAPGASRLATQIAAAIAPHMPSPAVLTKAARGLAIAPPPAKIPVVQIKGDAALLRKHVGRPTKANQHTSIAHVKKPPAKAPLAAGQPKPLGHQPAIHGRTEGVLVTRHGKAKGRYVVDTKHGQPGLLVLKDGHIVRHMFSRA